MESPKVARVGALAHVTVETTRPTDMAGAGMYHTTRRDGRQDGTGIPVPTDQGADEPGGAGVAGGAGGA